MMNEDKNLYNSQFDETIKNKLYNYEVEPNAGLWANIEEAIQTDAPVAKKNNRSKYFLLLLAFASLIGISATSSFYILNNQSGKVEVKNNSIDASQFAMNYNQANTTSTNVQIANNNLTAAEKYKIEGVIIASDNTKHIFITTIAPTNLTISTIAAENRISNYKEVPSMLLTTINKPNNNIAFNQSKQEEEPIFKTNHTNSKGIYLGANAQVFTNIIPKNNSQNKMFGNNVQYTPSFCYKAGLIVGYNISNKVALQTGVNYIRKTNSYVGHLYDAVNKGKLNLSYVEMPLTVKYKTNWVGKNQKANAVNVFAGLSYAYLVRAEAMMNNQKFKHYNNKNYNAKEYLPNHQLNFVAGVEYQIYVRKNIALSFGAEANYGGSASEINNWTQKNTTAFTNVGVGFNTAITFSTKKVIK